MEKNREFLSTNEEVLLSHFDPPPLRSQLHVLCRLMRLHSGHVTLPGAEFQPSKLSPQSDLRRRAASCCRHVGLCPIFLVFLWFSVGICESAVCVRIEYEWNQTRCAELQIPHSNAQTLNNTGV